MQQHRPGPNAYAGVTTEQDRHTQRVYRKRVRGVRVRWLISGLLLGLLGGIVLTIAVSALVVTKRPLPIKEDLSEPDVSVTVSESYLNRATAERVATFSTGMEYLTLTSLRLDLQPGHRMDLQPTFHSDLGFFVFDTSAIVSNQLAVENGKL
ncbi:MAG TPA: hypothetical protein VFG99_11270, partial [Chloroflexia bacterium]|nr:hypothetical protein [Chloroflexia bacterium]